MFESQAFGRWLGRARGLKGAGWTQERLARESGVSVNTIAALERGRIKNPRLDTVLALCNALQVDFFAHS